MIALTHLSFNPSVSLSVVLFPSKVLDQNNQICLVRAPLSPGGPVEGSKAVGMFIF